MKVEFLGGPEDGKVQEIPEAPFIGYPAAVAIPVVDLDGNRTGMFFVYRRDDDKMIYLGEKSPDELGMT